MFFIKFQVTLEFWYFADTAYVIIPLCTYAHLHSETGAFNVKVREAHAHQIDFNQAGSLRLWIPEMDTMQIIFSHSFCNVFLVFHLW